MNSTEQHQEKNENPRRALFKSLSPWSILLFLSLLVMMGILLGGAVTFAMNAIYGTPLNEVMASLSETSEQGSRQYVRIALMTNHVFLFILPPFVLSLIFFRKQWYQLLGLVNLSGQRLFINVALGTLIVLSSMPFIQYIFFLNKNYLPLPEWARNIEDSTNAMIKNLLVTEAPWEIAFNILVIAVIPALGEEFLFRGVIQKQLGRIFRNVHPAVWVAAAIFSVSHLQLEGFFPRLFLGAILGYLFYWSKSLWIPVIIHFIYNAMQIIVLQLLPDQLNALETTTTIPVPLSGALLSLAIVLGLSIFFRNYNHKFELAKSQICKG